MLKTTAQGTASDRSTIMYWHDNGMGGWGYAFMGVSMVLFWGLVIFALIRSTNSAHEPKALPHTTPEQLLADRFARGEIDTQEYRERLDVLRGGHHQSS